MKTRLLHLLLIWFLAGCLHAADSASSGPAPETAQPTPPPAAPVKRSADELQKLAAPIALYPDSLIATILPASVYPLEIVQAARLVANTNNLDQLDQQPWDDSVKAVARVPEVIKKLNEDIPWTIELGEAFLAQDKDLMDAIQALRGKAQTVGILQNTPQQVVVVTNVLVEKTVEQQVVVVTNTVVQIQSSNPEVVYVPQYNPAVVYAPPPSYVYDPVAPVVTFGVGMAMGAIIANNNCDWYHGGCYHGNVDVDIDRNVNRNVNRNTATARSGTPGGQKWQPDQNRLRTSGSPSASSRTAQARGWGSSGARPSTPSAAGAGRPSASTGAVGGRPTTGTGGARPSSGSVGARPSAGTSAAGRPAATPAASRQGPSSGASRSSASPSVNRSGGGGSAFGGMSSGGASRGMSSRGAASRGGGGRGGGGRR
jgi:hypothetical protein